jgi:phosphoglucosamine mutase
VARKLFGTDGVRGVAGELLTADLAVKLGRAATLQARAATPRVLVIRDTRESGEMLESALAAGVASAGGEVFLGGVLPTPAAPLLVGRYGFDVAAVISASHNPYRDNGIKFFGADGLKLSDATEEAIEDLLDEASTAEVVGRIRALHGTEEDYLRELHTRFAELDLSGTNVLLDCANGATYAAAPEIFRRLGATVTAIADAPDGRNINEGCGSTHVGALAAQVAEGGHDVGFAFDGDGDRVLAVDRNAVIVDGDELIALAALHLRAAGRLPGDGVAVTVMTNYGFHSAMKEHGIEVATTQVGDRYVLEEMLRIGSVLGGEQSGHVIFRHHATTGDGLLTAVRFLSLAARRSCSVAELVSFVRRFPQVVRNVPVERKEGLDDAAAVWDEVRRAEADLDGSGRVLVRASGTEPLVRLMVEAESEDEARTRADAIAEVVRAALG